ncbi:MAG: hypothetical protein CVU57_20350 [Deltaproteobacteria bacterium HGW-Deltaproteobacteria-15]|nr:MAG: hypothetical protein CVU57_20350 [Deltaproteobacteria bacterium HGW-Deltaproteobacteria-15]
MDRAEASSRGLLARDKGRTGFRIGKDASDNLYTGYRAGKISEPILAGWINRGLTRVSDLEEPT